LQDVFLVKLINLASGPLEPRLSTLALVTTEKRWYDRANHMKRAIQVLEMATLAVLLPLAGSAPAGAQDGVSVCVNAPTEAEPDSQFTATVDITDVTDFDAGQFDISYDESVLRLDLDNVTAGRMGSTEIPVASWNQVGTGTYRIVVNVPGVPGVSGSGSLATLSFRVIGSAGDSSAVGLSNGFLNNNLGSEIAATWTGDSVKVGGEADSQSSPVPKLLIGALLGAVLVGLTGYFWLRRRRVQKA